MKNKMKLLVAPAVAAVIALAGSPVSAQDTPVVTVDPAAPDAGEQELTVTGEGYTVDGVFVVPCTGANNLEQLVELGADACDLGNLTPATLTDGAFEVTITVDVPAEGMCISAGDLAQTQVGAVCFGGDAAAGDDGGDEEAADAEAEEQTDEEPLPETGLDAQTLGLLGAALIGAGGLTALSIRRFSRS